MLALAKQPHDSWHFIKKGKGTPLLFLHGWSFDATIWYRQLEELSKHFCIIALDLPGHGMTKYRRIKDFAKELHLVLETLHIDKARLIGHSFGGFIALQFAAAYPQCVERLVLIGTPAKFVSSSDYPFGLTKSQIVQLKRFLAEEYPIILSVFLRWLFSKKERTHEDFTSLWHKLTQRPCWPDKEALSWMLSLIEEGDLRKQLDRIKMPTLIINGTQDPICPKKAAEYLYTQLPNAHIELFEECGHLPFLTYAENFNHFLNMFLCH